MKKIGLSATYASYRLNSVRAVTTSHAFAARTQQVDRALDVTGPREEVRDVVVQLLASLRDAGEPVRPAA